MLDQLLDQRTLLLFGHVVGAILLLGPLTAAASRFPRVVATTERAPGDVAVAGELHRTTLTYGSASVVVPVLGLVLALRGDLLGALWIQASLGLVAVAGVLLFALVLPQQGRLIARLRSGQSGTIGRTDVARLRAATGLLSMTWVVIVLLMVWKPS